MPLASKMVAFWPKTMSVVAMSFSTCLPNDDFPVFVSVPSPQASAHGFWSKSNVWFLFCDQMLNCLLSEQFLCLFLLPQCLFSCRRMSSNFSFFIIIIIIIIIKGIYRAQDRRRMCLSVEQTADASWLIADGIIESWAFLKSFCLQLVGLFSPFPSFKKVTVYISWRKIA